MTYSQAKASARLFAALVAPPLPAHHLAHGLAPEAPAGQKAHLFGALLWGLGWFAKAAALYVVGAGQLGAAQLGYRVGDAFWV